MAKMTTAPQSPTLSDMEFDASDNAPTHIVLGSQNPLPGEGTQFGAMKRLSRYLPSDSRDAFIGPLPPTAAVSGKNNTIARNNCLL